ncbi:uncharacterized protein PRCAT00005814001 [Priceomyces carsonii]|uniref:uncharacterized protein n=1 Tax=Priceomyces carsonii TaxID=28549 RepID=UPI002EDBB61D|nr:unnamed protein product [Priceomyces carsonii]
MPVNQIEDDQFKRSAGSDINLEILKSDHSALNESCCFEKPWYTYRHLQVLTWHIFVITLASTNYGYDGSMLNGLQVFSKWNETMSYPTGSILGALSNGTVFGTILSFFGAAWFADRIGRKYCIIIGSVITVIGSILQGVSTNYGFFMATRLIIGFGTGFSSVSAPTLIAELAFPDMHPESEEGEASLAKKYKLKSYRSDCTSAYGVFWYLGATVAAWVTYGTRVIDNDYCWKIPSYLQGFFPLLQAILMWWVPESPRYLVSKGRIKQAERILRRYHTGNSFDEKANRLVEYEIKEIQAALKLDEIASKSKYSDFITIPSFRRRGFIIVFLAAMLNLSGNGLVSYYLNKVLDSIGITGEKRQLEINGALMIYNLVTAAVAALYVGKFKRRSVFLFSVALMLIFYVIWTVLSAINQKRNFEQKSLGNGVLGMIFLYYAAYNIGLNGLPYLYTTEFLPYSHRAKGQNLFQVAMNIIIIYNGFVNPVAMDSIDWKYYIVYCCTLAVELVVVYFVFIETYGNTLEEASDSIYDNLQLKSSRSKTNHSESFDKIDVSQEHLTIRPKT